jgi:hypothetical protein
MIRHFILTCLMAIAVSCGPVTTKPTLTSRGAATSGTLSLELLTETPFAVGLNRLFYKLTDGGKAVDQGHVAQAPLMTMPMMQHSCPVIDPAHDANADGLFEGVVIFNMPSSDTEQWDLSVDAMPHGAAAESTFTFPKLSVADSANRKMLTAGSMMYLVTMSFAGGKPKTGSNTVTVSVHKPTDDTKMTWVEVNDVTFAMTPEMPAMGHGSSGNVAPKYVADGLSTGTVNFSMSGDWVVHLDVLGADGGKLGTLDFAYSL